MSNPKSSIQNALEESNRVKRGFFEKNEESIVEVARKMGGVIKAGNRILICGNGGSASDSQHFAGEMVGRLMKERRALPAIALTTDTSVLTAVGNDYGYDQVFSRQVEGIGASGDLLFTISTSGNSPNILRAAESAKAMGITVVALTGKDGGKLGRMADVHLNAGLGVTSPRIQETHITAIHVLVDLLDEYFFYRGTGQAPPPLG